MPPAGTEVGAVNVVETVLRVEPGLNEPQVFAGAQVQFTPAASVVVAAITAVLFGPEVESDAGGAVEIETVIPEPAEIATLADADFEVSLTDVALIVTVPPAGTVEGDL